jgi:hypothetical protein
MKTPLILLIPVLAASVSCAGQAKEAAKYSSSDWVNSPNDRPASPSGGAQAEKETEGVSRLVGRQQTSMPRNVVKSGSMTIQVDSVDQAEKQARSIAETLGGRVDRVTSADLASPQASMDMTLRVPVMKFEGTMEQLQALGTRLAKTVEVQDVTEQIIDFNARLKTMRVQEELVRTMLKRAGSLEDSLTINNDLTRLRAEIESLDAKRSALASQAAFSTLELKLVQKSSAVAVASTDPNWFQTSWAEAWGAGTSVFRTVVGMLMWLVVFAPVWIVGIVLALRVIKHAGTSTERAQPARN